MSETDVILRARGLVRAYEKGRIRALDGVDLVLGRGEFLSVIGRSGCGKSTLLHLLGALDRPDEGTIELDGRDLVAERRLDRVRARELGFVFQLHNLVPSLSARENVELPLYSLDVSRRERRDRALALLEAVDMALRAEQLPTKLSGGERQRVAIARALVNEPKLVLADEPTGDLDDESGRRVLALLQGIQAERGVTLVLVTHDLEIASAADRTVRLLDGRIVDEWRNETSIQGKGQDQD